MKIFDLNEFGSDSSVETDICIIGSGPAGMSIANELADTNTRVLVLESGGIETEPATQALYEILNTGVPRVMDQDILRMRILGGSSHVWTGRCAPFDECDYERRSWIPHSGWPITSGDLEPYLKRAAPYLGLAPLSYDDTLWRHFNVNPPRPALQSPFLRPMFWQFSRRPVGPGAAHFGDLADSDAPNIEILLHANVTHINLSQNGTRFDSLDISSLGGKQARIRAKAAILCCGGVENARLLLASNRVFAAGVGNQNDMVGRFLLDHISGPCGHFDAKNTSAIRTRFGQYWVDDELGRHVYLHGVALTTQVQREEGLLNCHAYLAEYDQTDNDPWPALGRLRSSLRSRRISGPDARLVLGNLVEIGRGLYRRRFQNRPQLENFNRLEFHMMLEQMPDPDSRVTLSEDTRDALGMPLSKIHWKIGDLERKTARRMLQLFADECQHLRLSIPRGIPLLNDLDEFIASCNERAHPTGATRMSTDPKEGVVDVNCQVHGVDGLFVAGSSVFPTAGAANPTLMIVATALRLADHLKMQYQDAPASAAGASSPPLRTRYKKMPTKPHSATAIKIGLIGASRRIAEVYLPILRQMPDQYEISGFTAFSSQGFRRFESKTGIKSFRSPEELVEQSKPELLLLAVPDRLNEAVLNGLLDFKVPVLAETPVAWTVPGTQRVILKAAANGVLLGVAEQFPVMPMERFRAQLLDTKILGDIYAAQNDFQSYSYHAIAQLRRYLKGRPCQVRANEYSFSPSPTDGISRQWQAGCVTFDDGSLLVHTYATPDRGVPGSIGIYGSRGAMQNREIWLTDAGQRGVGAFQVVRTERSPGHLASISVAIPGIDDIVWENPLVAHSFSDEEIAVATNLHGMSRAIREGLAPYYTANDFLADIEIIEAFRYSSARNGADISLPLQESQQKLRLFASPRYVKRKLFKR